MRRSYSLLLPCLLPLLVFLFACSATNSDPGEEDLAILFIGNSLTYTNDLPGVLRDMLNKNGNARVFVEAIAEPNFGLEDHWINSKTRSRISSAPWDYVVLQQGPSASSEGRTSLIGYSKEFATIIRDAGAVPALYMVWPEEGRLFDFAGVRASYLAAADSVDGLFLPSGAAWEEYWNRDGSVPLYGPDGFHPSAEGTYLAAVVMWEQFTGGDANDLDNIPGAEYGGIKITASVGRQLHDAAHLANSKYAR
ncbi:MAG: SGNH/GDSL hydrolase family protein [Bacteroidetes bacterium]|nr:SGNH/GDSL hydrolase family protein [Bacteroidota bacterium]